MSKSKEEKIQIFHHPSIGVVEYTFGDLKRELIKLVNNSQAVWEDDGDIDDTLLELSKFELALNITELIKEWEEFTQIHTETTPKIYFGKIYV